jgi:GGDEF domain-containing protein
LSGVEDVWKLCDKVKKALRQPIQIDGHELSISGSLGCVECPSNGDDEVTLLKHANEAMQQAKAAGGNTQFIYGSAAIPSH